MTLVEAAIKILEDTVKDGVSLLDSAYLSYDPKFGAWSGNSIENVEHALSEAAKSLPRSQLVREYNDLADQNEIDHISEWNYETQAMDLEIFIDSVYEMILCIKEATFSEKTGLVLRH